MRRAMPLALVATWTALAQTDTRDVALARQLAQEVERQSTLVTDAVIVDYVNHVGLKVAQAPLEIKVIVSGNSHAVAFPGVSMYLDTGLILMASNEAELAGAIAHQLGHVALWHESQDPPAVGQIPLIFAGAACLRGRGTLGMAMPMGYRSRQVELESRADQLGLSYLDKAGYDPGALADLYERILAPKVLPASTRAEAATLRGQRTNYLVTTSEFRAMQQRMASLPPATPRLAAGPTLNRGK